MQVRFPRELCALAIRACLRAAPSSAAACYFELFRQPGRLKATMTVIPFRTREPGLRQRRSGFDAPDLGGPAIRPRHPVTDLSAFERLPGADDYRHRMFVNTLAFAFAVVLVIAGLWLVTSMERMQTLQDCALVGRHNCAPVDVRSLSR